MEKAEFEFGSPENGILTPTLKLKRREVHKHFGDMIKTLYE